MARKFWIVAGLNCAVLFIFGFIIFFISESRRVDLVSPLGGKTTVVIQKADRSLEKYSFDNLSKRPGQTSKISFDRQIKKGPGFESRVFFFQTEGKKISGVANFPSREFDDAQEKPLVDSSGECATCSARLSSSPVIVMVHGFVEDEEYYPGFGTEKVAGELTKAGFVTLAPDFAGLGESDGRSENIFKDRFQSYTTVLDLITSVCSLQTTVNCRIGLWGHSNGGQIALSVLAILRKPIPTALWNPVSKMFPYSILFYTDVFDDHGKILRKELARFEGNYDAEKFSVTNYFDWINAPIILQQGEIDQWVPKKWSDELNERLKMKNEKLLYKIYAGSDHNLVPRWNEAVGDLKRFYSEYL